MELVNDLLVTASLALVLSFLVNKLVSIAMSDRDSHSPTSVHGISRAESSSRVQSHQNEGKVEVLVPESVKTVDEFTEIHGPGSVENPESDDIELAMKSSEVVEIREEAMEEKEKVEQHLEDFAKQGNSKIAADSEEIAVVKERNEEERQVKLEFEEEDDWEGIERGELEMVFMAAVEFVAGNKDERLASIGSDEQVELYGLHKLATEGPCRDPQPMPLMLSARAKWNAWQKLGNMNPDVAMEQYITLLSEKVPGWMEDNSAGKGEQEQNKSELFDSAAIHSCTSLSHQQNLIIESKELEQQSGAQNCSLPVESDLDNNVKK